MSARPSAASPGYVGRFAPSPTGSLHLGSLVAAVGSFVDARSRGGRWLLRMEDLDAARVIPGCADEMLRTLEGFALHWDGAVEYQSARTEHYARAQQALTGLGLTFQCSCSRRERTPEGGYPGTCRDGPRRRGPTATRFRVEDRLVSFQDRAQGVCRFPLRERGDVIIRRRDGAFAYQLAVVVDDATQGVTDVVRGADLLDSTARQIALQRLLGYATPRYLHTPVATDGAGEKLSKQTRAADAQRDDLRRALDFLGMRAPGGLASAKLLEWALEHWDPARVPKLRAAPAS